MSRPYESGTVRTMEPYSTISVTVMFDNTSGMIALLNEHHSPVRYLVLSNDNLSGIWRYMITENSNFPAEDLENWITFPTNPIDNATRANLFQDSIIPGLDNYSLGDLEYIANRTNTHSTANATFSVCLG